MSSDSSVATTVSARALASRQNGARSRGPKTAAGKARSSRNALKHGLCATKLVVLREDAVQFRALEAALLAELAPVGALQGVLAQRVVSAAWRLRRADRFEAEVLDFRSYDNADLGVALMRDGNGPRSIETVMRYRGAATAELLRALKTLQTLQAQAAAAADRPAAPPARRRARPPASKRIELEQMRQRNPSSAEPAVEPRQNAPDRKRVAGHPGPLPVPARKTKRTQESQAEQDVGVGSKARCELAGLMTLSGPQTSA